MNMNPFLLSFSDVFVCAVVSAFAESADCTSAEPCAKIIWEKTIAREEGRQCSWPSGATNSDLGYPAYVELDDGSILTVYYQQPPIGGKPCIMATKWRIMRFREVINSRKQ